jgi:Lipase (class 3)
MLSTAVHLVPACLAPPGFLQQFASVLDPSNDECHIGKVLSRLSGGRQPTRVLVTGHSLGGALATLGKAFL